MAQEREGLGRTMVALPGAQLAVMQQVCAAAKGPCIVVSMNGGGVDLSWAVQADVVDSILWIGYPGPLGGQALADSVFGANVPAGRTITTWHDAAFVDSVSLFGEAAGAG